MKKSLVASLLFGGVVSSFSPPSGPSTPPPLPATAAEAAAGTIANKYISPLTLAGVTTATGTTGAQTTNYAGKVLLNNSNAVVNNLTINGTISGNPVTNIGVTAGATMIHGPADFGSENQMTPFANVTLSNGQHTAFRMFANGNPTDRKANDPTGNSSFDGVLEILNVNTQHQAAISFDRYTNAAGDQKYAGYTGGYIGVANNGHVDEALRGNTYIGANGGEPITVQTANDWQGQGSGLSSGTKQYQLFIVDGGSSALGRYRPWSYWMRPVDGAFSFTNAAAKFAVTIDHQNSTLTVESNTVSQTYYVSGPGSNKTNLLTVVTNIATANGGGAGATVQFLSTNSFQANGGTNTGINGTYTWMGVSYTNGAGWGCWSNDADLAWEITNATSADVSSGGLSLNDIVGGGGPPMTACPTCTYSWQTFTEQWDIQALATAWTVNGQSNIFQPATVTGQAVLNVSLAGNGAGLTNLPDSALRSPPDVNVLDFGADPSGTLDSTTAFQSAFTYVYSQGSDTAAGTIRIPSGHYKITNTITIPAHAQMTLLNIKGDGRRTSRIYCTLTNKPAFDCGQNDGIKFDNLAFYDPNHTGWGIFAGAATTGSAGWQLEVDRCYFLGFKNTIICSNRWMVNIHDSDLSDAIGTHITFAGTHDAIVHNVRIHNSTVGDTGIRFLSTSVGDCDVGTIDGGSFFNNMTNGVVGEKLSFNVLGNHFEDCGWYVVASNSAYANINYNYFIDNIPSTTTNLSVAAVNIVDTSTAQQSTMSGNIFQVGSLRKEVFIPSGVTRFPFVSGYTVHGLSNATPFTITSPVNVVSP